MMSVKKIYKYSLNTLKILLYARLKHILAS